MSVKNPSRRIKKGVPADLGEVELLKYNEATGATKVMIIQPDIIKTTLASEIVGAGKLVKIAAVGTYNLELNGRDYSSSSFYNRGDVVANGANVYMALEDNITGTFDATRWKEVAAKTITGIPNAAGDVVSTGKWHNAISVAGFLVEDDTDIPFISARR